MHNKLSAKILLNCGLIILIAGCAGGTFTDPTASASGTQVNYEWFEGAFDISTQAKIRVGVIDRREYILSGDKPAQFTGLAREGFGIPHDVTTKSENSLANDFALSIVSGFESAGITANAVTLGNSDIENTRSSLLDEEADRYILLVLNGWKTNTYQETELVYNLDLSIFTSEGNQALHKNFTGNDVGQGKAWTPKGRHIEIMEQLYPKKLQEIFENPEVKAALRLDN